MREKYTKQVLARHHNRRELVKNNSSQKQSDRSSSHNKYPKPVASHKIDKKLQNFEELDEINRIIKNEMDIDQKFNTQNR